MEIEKVPEKMNVGLINHSIFFEFQRSETGAIQLVGGTAAEYLLLIQKALNVEFEYVVEQTEQFYVDYKNGTAGGVGGLLERGVVDFIYGGIHMTDFIPGTHPYDYNDIRFCAPLPKIQTKTWSFIEPFTTTVWIYICVALMLIALVLFWVSHKKRSFADHLFNVIALLLQQGCEIEPSAGFINWFSFGNWALAAKLLGFFYISIFLSIITAPLKDPPINTVDKLWKEIEGGKMDATTFRDTKYLLRTLLTSNISSYNKLGYHIVNRNKYIYESIKLKYALDHNNAVILHKNYLFKFGLDEKVIISEDVLDVSLFAIYVKKDFCCLENLNRITLRILEGGIYKQTQEQVYRKNELFKLYKNEYKKVFEESENNFKPLTLKDLKGCFTFFTIGISLALLVFLLELICKKLKRRNSSFT